MKSGYVRIENQNGTFFVYYKSSDKGMKMAMKIMETLTDYVMNKPEDAGRTQLSATQRDPKVENSLKIMPEKYPFIKF